MEPVQNTPDPRAYVQSTSNWGACAGCIVSSIFCFKKMDVLAPVSGCALGYGAGYLGGVVVTLLDRAIIDDKSISARRIETLEERVEELEHQVVLLQPKATSSTRRRK